MYLRWSKTLKSNRRLERRRADRLAPAGERLRPAERELARAERVRPLRGVVRRVVARCVEVVVDDCDVFAGLGRCRNSGQQRADDERAPHGASHKTPPRVIVDEDFPARQLNGRDSRCAAPRYRQSACGPIRPFLVRQRLSSCPAWNCAATSSPPALRVTRADSSGAKPLIVAPSFSATGATSISPRLRSIARSVARATCSGDFVPDAARQRDAGVLEHAGVADEAGEDRRHADAGAVQLGAQRAGEAAQAELRRAVDRAARPPAPCPTATT